VKRIQDAKHPIQRLPTAASGPYRIAIARDPSGNAIEIFARDSGPYAVGGAKLIVADRQKAEDFFVQVFGVKPVQRFNTATYDEVLLGFNQGFVALFQPKNEEALPKSQFPVVAIYTTEFDNVVERVKQIGLGYREIKGPNGSRIVIAKDPSGNGVEIIAR
jgi:catechol 2,3-dioxygenase-like lactoylglutathione lyase family enzyme